MSLRGAFDDGRWRAPELRPPTLDEFGLQAALRLLTRELSQCSGLEVQLRIDMHGLDLDPDQETAIYRLVQEALTNAVKYASASSVSIGVTARAGVVHAMIEDDGVGFAVDEVRDGALGLVGIREHVMSLGGRFEIDTAPGAGTTLFVELRDPATSSAFGSLTQGVTGQSSEGRSPGVGGCTDIERLQGACSL